MLKKPRGVHEHEHRACLHDVVAIAQDGQLPQIIHGTTDQACLEGKALLMCQSALLWCCRSDSRYVA